jgi:hypothetical protein
VLPEQNYVATRGFTSNATDYAITDPIPKDLPSINEIKSKGLVVLDISDEGIKAAERRREIEKAAERGAAVAAQPDHAHSSCASWRPYRGAWGDYEMEVESSPEVSRGADFTTDVQTQKLREI